MVVLAAAPSRATIDLLAGAVDFYLWKGIPVARSWPRWRPRQSTPAEKANQDRFALAVSLYNQLTPEQKASWRAMATGTTLTARDVFMKAYMVGLDFPPD